MTKIEKLRKGFASGMSEARISDDQWNDELLPMLEDAARLDWIAKWTTEMRHVDITTCPGAFIVSYTADDGDTLTEAIGETLRKAIDAARTLTKETP